MDDSRGDAVRVGQAVGVGQAQSSSDRRLSCGVVERGGGTDVIVELQTMAVDDSLLKDEMSTTTDSIPNGSSAANINVSAVGDPPPDFDDTPKPHPFYLIPPKIDHPLEASVLSSFARSVLLRVVGVLVAVPLLLVILLGCLLALPVRLLLFVSSRCYPLKALFREPFTFSPAHCDPWWPLGGGGGDGSVVHCVLTVQHAFVAADARQQLFDRAVAPPANHARPNFPRYSRTRHQPAATCCAGLRGRWTRDDDFAIAAHIVPIEEMAISRINNLKDLEVYLNNPPSLSDSTKSPWLMNLIGSFGSAQEGTSCSLAVLHVDAELTDQLCVPRLLSLWTESRLVFDTEPKMRRSSVAAAAGVLPPYNVFLGLSYGVWNVCQIGSLGALSILTAVCRKRHAVWTDCRTPYTSINRKRFRDSAGGGAQKKYRRTTTASVNGGGDGGGGGGRSSSLCSSALLSTAATGAAGGAGGASSPNQHHRVTWCRIPNMDQLLRAERILRAATVDMFLAFVAGALRRHFRSQGIRHPPDIQASMPVSSREFLPVSSQKTCKFCLVPVTLPTGTEGAIPRIWAVQRNLTDAFDSTFPKAASLARTLGEFFLPQSATRSVLGAAHRATGCIVSILRATGNVNIDSRRLHSMLLYAPVPEHVPVSFTFIQCGSEMVASVSLDPNVFPDADKLLGHLQAEIQGLLGQLSVRLLTLSQATFLPVQFPPAPQPISVVGRAPAMAPAASELYELNEVGSPPSTVFTADGATIDLTTTAGLEPGGGGTPMRRPSTSRQSNASSTFGGVGAVSHDLMTRDTMRSSIDNWRELAASVGGSDDEGAEDYDEHNETSLAQLEKLLTTVQDELETMKANPQGDRADYLAKLTILENRMEAFHRSIARRLGPNFFMSENIDFGDDPTAVEDLLAPYRDESTSSSPSRRESRDSRRDSVIKLIRKRSKRTESPTRRISMSPKVSDADIQLDAAHLASSSQRYASSVASSRSAISGNNLEP